MKINFTKNHLTKLTACIVASVFENEFFTLPFGQKASVQELVHGTPISTLEQMRRMLDTKIESASQENEWVMTDEQRERVKNLCLKREGVNLIIGYKLWRAEMNGMTERKEAIEKKIAEVKERNMTPEQQIAELEAELGEINKQIDSTKTDSVTAAENETVATEENK